MRGKRVLWLLFCLLINGMSLAQQWQIKGRILDKETGEPLPYASVFLQKLPLWELVKGCVSDEQGYFVMSTPSGKQVLSVKYLGYALWSKGIEEGEDTTIDLGNIFLQPSSQELDIVMVKPLVEQSVDKIIYNLSSDPDREKLSLSEILGKVPMIKTLPNGNFFIDSPDKKFLIVRNGKRDALFSGNVQDILKQLPAMGFSTVRLLLAPPEHYGEYDYVLDIITDKTKRVAGAVGELSGNYESGDNLWRLHPALTFSASKLRGHLQSNVRRAVYPVSRQDILQSYFISEEQTEQTKVTFKNMRDYDGKGVFSYDMGEKQFLSLSLSFGSQKNYGKSDLDVLESAMGKVLHSYHTFSNQQTKQRLGNASLDYQYNFTKPDRIFNISLLYKSDHKDLGHHNHTKGLIDYPDRKLRDDRTDSSKEQAVQLSYVDPLTKRLELEVSLKYLHRENDSRTVYEKWNFPEGKWEFEEHRYSGLLKENHIWNAYLQMAYRTKKLRLSGALHAEYLDDGKGTRVIDGGTGRYIKEKGGLLSPDLRFSYMFPELYMSLRYSCLQRRPSLDFLQTTIPDPQAEVILVGNPDLSPVRNHHCGIQFRFGKKVSTDISLTYSYSGNEISRFWYENDKGQTVQTYRNFGNSHSISLGGNVGYYRLQRFYIVLMPLFNYEWKTIERGEVNNSGYSGFTVNCSYSLKSKWIFFLNGGGLWFFYNGMEGYTSPPWNLSLKVSKKWFKDKLELGVDFANLLRLSRENTVHVTTPEMYMRNTTVSGRFACNFTLRYRLGSFKVKPVKSAKKKILINDVMNLQDLDPMRQ